MIKKTKCIVCGTTFSPHYKKPTIKTCSKLCGQRLSYRKQNPRRPQQAWERKRDFKEWLNEHIAATLEIREEYGIIK